jgi:hypothetical protein
MDDEWRKRREQNAKLILVCLCVWAVLGVLILYHGVPVAVAGLWGDYKSKSERISDLEAQVDDLTTRLVALEHGTSTFHAAVDHDLMVHQMTLDILITEVETMSYRYVQAQNVIMYLDPKTDPFLSWKIAFYTVITADSYGIDPFLVLALIHHESGFDPKAIGTSGEYGLMQIMKYWCKVYGVQRKELFDIHTNIDVGTGILDSCLYEEHFRLAYALGCYNGSGPRANYATTVNASYEDLLKKFPRIENDYERPTIETAE